MRFESHPDDSVHADPVGRVPGLLEDLLVTEVHSVEGADGDDRTSQVGRDLRERAPDAHGDPFSSEWTAPKHAWRASLVPGEPSPAYGVSCVG